MPGVRYYTVVFPFSAADGRRVLLGLKKRGMGEGLWNGFGGKPEPGETMEQCARRELKEECGLEPISLAGVGVLLMERTDGTKMTIFVYTTNEYSGEVAESDEMKPQWFDAAGLTYEKTFTEARVWWPAMLAGKPFIGRFKFGENAMLSHEIAEVSPDQLKEHLPERHFGF